MSKVDLRAVFEASQGYGRPGVFWVAIAGIREDGIDSLVAVGLTCAIHYAG